MDKTYIRVGGTWCYLYRAITAGGQTLDFYLSPKRNVAAAKRFLAKTLRSNAPAGSPQVKYLNNVIDGDHGRLKPILGPKGAFKKPNVFLPDSERDGSDALLVERSGDDV
ncbi:hypothetical protein H924_02130 [Corynebacterium callunae DSM 20147]|uniref:DDE domain-containing protein n=1 Tax=Corynebacterium callunae DSM 20147 TaxID=1121353 RepID=M1UD84_9CORY|nr:hypothetical protein H924_02130 [Corynebacterium callunae DSM 20147]